MSTVLFVERISEQEVSVVPYDPEQHRDQATKFLSFKGADLVIVGAFLFHDDLFKAYNDLDHQTYLERQISGAGTCGNGVILCWESAGFGKKTSSAYRPFIKKALGMEESSQAAKHGVGHLVSAVGA